MKKETNEKRYVQLGARRSNRIVKAENFDIEEFVMLMLRPFELNVKETEVLYLKGYNKIDKLFKTKKYKYYVSVKEKSDVYHTIKKLLIFSINHLIDQDKEGKHKIKRK